VVWRGSYLEKTEAHDGGHRCIVVPGHQRVGGDDELEGCEDGARFGDTAEEEEEGVRGALDGELTRQ